jgi:hypothetical protein
MGLGEIGAILCITQQPVSSDKTPQSVSEAFLLLRCTNHRAQNVVQGFKNQCGGSALGYLRHLG